MQILNQTNFDFVRWRWHAIALSLLVILAGAATIWTRGLSLGVDFAGGSIVIVKFEQGTPVERVRAAINNMPNGVGNDAVVQEYGEPAQHMVMVRVAQTAAQSSGNLSADADAVVAALKQANVGAFEVVGTEIVGPVVGGLLAVGIAFVLRGRGGDRGGIAAAQGTLGEAWGGAPAPRISADDRAARDAEPRP